MENKEIMVESLVLSSLFQDLTLINDYPITEEHFQNSKCKFFFSLAKGLSSYKELTEVTVATWIAQNGVLEKNYEKYGGWESIENVRKLGSAANFDEYVDSLFKQNFIRKLKEKGFNLDKKIEIDGNEVRPKDLFINFTSEQIYQFYELLLNDASINTSSSDMVLEDLFYTDEEIKNKLEGKDNHTTPFDTTLIYKEDTGEEKRFKPMKLLNDAIDGITSKQGIYFIGGMSGSGKSTITLSICMGLVNAGSKIILVSNEVLSSYFKEMFVCYVSTIVFKTPSINRRKLAHMDLTKEEYEVFVKANEYIKENYSGKFKFINVADFNVEKITKIAKKLNLAYGFDTLVLETFKSENDVEDTVNNMVMNSRYLDKFGKQNDMKVILPIQLRTSDEGVISYLTSSSIAGSKAVKEVAHSILLVRKTEKGELDPSSKMFLKPYRWAKNEETGKYYKKYFKIKNNEEDNSRRRRRGESPDDEYLDPNLAYRIVFINKCRSASDTDKILLMQFDGEKGICNFRAYCDYVYPGRLNGY